MVQGENPTVRVRFGWMKKLACLGSFPRSTDRRSDDSNWLIPVSIKSLFISFFLLWVPFVVRADADSVYQMGLSVYPTNAVAAYECFLKAAAGGKVESMTAVGHCCENGSGIATNLEMAARWYGIALEKDAAMACKGLSEINSLWRGVRNNDLDERTKLFAQSAADARQVNSSAMRLLAEGRQLDTEDLLDRAIARFPVDQRILFVRGVLWRSRFCELYAKFYFYAVQSLDGSTPMGQASGVVLAMDRGEKVSDGFEGLQNLARKNPDDLFLHWLFCIQSREHRKHSEEAAAYYKVILKQWNPGPVLVHQTYANILSEQLGRHEEALKHRRIAVELDPQSWSYQGLANTLSKLERYREAEPAYAKAVELDPLDPQHWFQWGACLRRLGRKEDAAKCDARLFELVQPSEMADFFGRWAESAGGPAREPSPPSKEVASMTSAARRSQSIALKKEGIKYSSSKGDLRDIPKAIELYEQAYALYPEVYTAYQIGNLYLWEEPYRDYALAREWLDIALEADFLHAHLCMARYYCKGYDEKARDGAKAVYHAETAVRLYENDNRGYALLAEAHAYCGRYREAVAAQQEAISLVKPSPTSQSYLESLQRKLDFYRQRASEQSATTDNET